ncbi:MAG: hypothetical protein ACHQF2_06280 [Flavobacteriales bacterium]
MRNYFLSAAFVILYILGCSCVCFEIPNVKSAYKQADVVLSVTVLKILPTHNSIDTAYIKNNDSVFVRQIFGFDKQILIQSVYKGQNIKDTMIIKGEGSNCELRLRVGQEYLIYGWLENGKINTSQCTRSAFLKDNPDIPYLEKRKRRRK